MDNNISQELLNNINSSKTNASRGVNEQNEQYLTFILAGEEYGVDILRVQEIRGWSLATKIPNVPEYIKGVINLRGTIVPIMDLRNRFRLDESTYGQTTVVIVLKILSDKGEHRVMGIVVDAVSDVYNVNDDQIKPTPDFGNQLSLNVVKGLAAVNTQDKEKMVIILNIDHLMNTDDFDQGSDQGIKTDNKAA
jgi:purine-binding chemotaxis protein CheW